MPPVSESLLRLDRALRAPALGPPADVCLLVEGTYPYVPGGVSSWVHDLVRGMPDRTFEVVNIGAHPGAYGQPRYQMTSNVLALHRLFCRDGVVSPMNGPERAALDAEIREIRRRTDREPPSRMLRALRRMHLEESVDDQLLDDLTSGDLDLAKFLYGRASFDLLVEIGERLAPDTSFLDLFWHYRAMHVPLIRLLAAPAPPAGCYHAVSTGYAGLLGAAWGHMSGRPFVLTEHGIYSRERDMELSRADWIRDDQKSEGLAAWLPVKSPLRRLWSRLFRKLALIAYARASQIITLSDANRRKQIADGAPAHKIRIVPNGVDLPEESNVLMAGGALPANGTGDAEAIVSAEAQAPLRVGFVGRVVPIKDVVTLIKACDLALRKVPLDVRIIGPDEEDGGYAARCKALVRNLGRQDSIRFVGPMPPSKIYRDLDVVVLTSFSEGQPLVILEAYASGVPVIATDVGACREMVEGSATEDRHLGPSGFVTRVAQPQDTASALIALANDRGLAKWLGMTGRKRVSAYYQKRDMLRSYQNLYQDMVSS